MRLTSQFDIGQKVVLIENRSKPTYITCTGCNGTGKIMLADGTTACCPKPRCSLGKVRHYPKPTWGIAGMLTIGLIRIEYRDSPGYPSEINADNYAPQRGMEERYMCVETGIGTGSVYTPQEHIFATPEAAQAECDRRNKE